MIPAGLCSDRLLVIVDFSWWLNRAFHSGGVDGMAAIVAGSLAELLRGDVPAYLGVALDSAGRTWRHEAFEGYKAGREPKPQEFRDVSRRLVEIVRLHRIPLLAAEGWEADDAIATATRLAVAAGLDVAILSADKDLAQLVGPAVWLWDGGARLRGEAEILDEWGVAPALLGDLLAITGDKADAVPGVDGIGPVRAAALLRAYGGLDAVLGAEPVVVAEDEIKRLERAVAKAKRAGEEAPERADLDALRYGRKLGADLARVQAAAPEVRIARRLVALDDHAPIAFDLDELAVGGYDVERLRAAYRALGFTALADEVRGFPKAIQAEDLWCPEEEE